MKASEKRPVIIYMHGNAGCKLESEEYVVAALEAGMDLFSFDFSGCGASEGQWVSLGVKERLDLAAVVAYLKGKVSKICLWGRSMGAATSIMYVSEEERAADIAGMVLDSPFTSVESLVRHIGTETLKMSPWAVSMVIPFVKAGVQKESKFSLDHMSPERHAPKCSTPALFIHGTNDELVPISHSEKLLAMLNTGDKELLKLEGACHNGSRPPEVINKGI